MIDCVNYEQSASCEHVHVVLHADVRTEAELLAQFLNKHVDSLIVLVLAILCDDGSNCGAGFITVDNADFETLFLKGLVCVGLGDNEGVSAGLTAYLNSADQPALFFSGEAVPDHIAAHKQRGCSRVAALYTVLCGLIGA